MAVQIDPKTGERIEAAPQIDPQTGERVAPGPTPPVDMSTVAGAPAGLAQPPTQQPANMQPSILGRADGTATQRLFGDKPLANSATVVGQHLKQLVTGPYHAFTDAPTSPDEMAIQGTQPAGALGLYRMLAKPTIDNAQASAEAFRGGDVNTGAQRAMDAIPIAGPWARGVENDAKTYGAIPALLGLGTDIAAPKAAGAAIPAAIRGAGAVARIASADAPSLSLAASRKLMKGTPGELLQSGLKPGAQYGAGAGAMLEQSLPDVLAQNPQPGVAGFAAASDAARDASFRPYNDLMSPYRSLQPGAAGPVRPSSLFGGPIADAQMASVPMMDRIEQPSTPGSTRTKLFSIPDGEGGKMNMGAQVGGTAPGGIMNRTADVAGNYRKNLTVPVLDEVRQDANGKLNAFYNKARGDRAAALANPETARVKAVGDSTRNLLYPQLESDAGLTPGTVPAMQEKYAMLNDVSDIANKREPVVARHDPVTLSQKVVAGHGNPLSMAWNYLVQEKLGELTNPDAQVNSAIDRFQNPTGTPLNARPGLFSQAGMNAGNAVRSLPSVPNIANPLFYAPKDKTKR